MICRMPLEHAVQCLDDLINGIGPDDGIHFRDFLLNLVMIALREATTGDEGLNLTALSPFGEFQKRIDAFLLGVSDEAAGIDDDGLRLFLVIRKGMSLLFQKTQHHLGIHEILVAAKGSK